jgi:hypothetical protein
MNSFIEFARRLAYGAPLNLTPEQQERYEKLAQEYIARLKPDTIIGLDADGNPCIRDAGTAA